MLMFRGRRPCGHPAGAAHRRDAGRAVPAVVHAAGQHAGHPVYERVGFTRAADIHEEVVDAALTLREYGFEIETADGKNKTETEL